MKTLKITLGIFLIVLGIILLTITNSNDTGIALMSILGGFILGGIGILMYVLFAHKYNLSKLFDITYIKQLIMKYLGLIIVFIFFFIVFGIAGHYDYMYELAEHNRIQQQEEYEDNASILITTVSQPEHNHYIDSVSNKNILICYRKSFEEEYADDYFLNETHDIVYTGIWYNGYLYIPKWYLHDVVIDEGYIIETTVIKQANSDMKAYYYEEDKLIEKSNEPLFIEWDYIMFEKATKEELEKLQ